MLKRRLIGACVRRFLEWAVPVRPRLKLLCFAARCWPARVGPQAFLRAASELSSAGHYQDAALCWKTLHHMAPGDTRIALKRISAAFEADDPGEAELALQEAHNGSGIPPRELIGLSGQLLSTGRARSGGRLLIHLAKLVDISRIVRQSPSLVSMRLHKDVRELGERIATCSTVSPYWLPVARLCYSFRAHEAAARLFVKADQVAPLDALDRVSMLHAQAESNPGALGRCDSTLSGLAEELSQNADALSAIVKVAVVTNRLALARETLSAALSLRYENLPQLSSVSEDCVAILGVLASLRDVDEVIPESLRSRCELEATGVPKAFVCGFGWSGSGALYDAVRGEKGFCEFEGSGRDLIINEDADSEVVFIQGAGGLGDIWKRAVEVGRIPWNVLWQTFNLHTAGLLSIGYAEYKCCAAARNHVARYGSLYTRPFRNFLERYMALRINPRPGGLQAILIETTESLCSMLARENSADAVLFNNAIFARDAVMLEIFSSYRAAVVYRDPRDIYVDRKRNDRNHWRTATQLATYYEYGLKRYASYKRNAPRTGPMLREVPFERFVKDTGLRYLVRRWLMEGLEEVLETTHFDPRVSSRNIGLYVGELTSEEEARLRIALTACRELDESADMAWLTSSPR